MNCFKKIQGLIFPHRFVFGNFSIGTGFNPFYRLNAPPALAKLI